MKLIQGHNNMARNHSPNHRGPSAFQNQIAITNYAKRKTRKIDISPPITLRCDRMAASMSIVGWHSLVSFPVRFNNELRCTWQSAGEQKRNN
jgi:hypothetical protein